MSTSTQEQRQESENIEIIDLGTPSTGNSASRWLFSTVLDFQRSTPRRHWKVASYLALAILSVTFCFLKSGPFALVPALFQSTPSSSPSTPAFPVLPQQDGVACLVDAAWSPDNHFIAVLGYGQGCGQIIDVPALVNLYDLHSKQVLKQFTPDGAIRGTLSGPASPFRTGGPIGPEEVLSPAIAYTHVLWSPDGHRLAFTFSLPALGPRAHGVVLMNSDGADPQVLFTQEGVSAPFSEEWQVSASSIVASLGPTRLSVPPALAYHWGTNGVLVPETLLTDQTLPTAPALGPVGNPDGGLSFTIWQPGVTTTMGWVVSSQRRPRVYTTWRTNFAAWSPDGHYLVEGIGLSAILKLQGQVEADQQADSLSNQALPLPARVVVPLQEVSTGMALAWRPDGQALAMYIPGKGIALYRCSDGYRLTSFVLSGQGAALPAESIVLRWSGDGARLFFWSAQGHLLILTGKENGRAITPIIDQSYWP